MKKGLLILFFAVLIVLPAISAANLKIEKVSTGEVWVSDLEKPILLDLQVTNNGPADSFTFYNLAGFTMTPVEPISIGSGETKTIEFELTPIGKLPESGYYTITYYAKATSDGSQTQNELTFKIVKLKDVFEIGSSDVNVEDNTLEIYMKNLENVNFDNLNVVFSSPFFTVEKNFSLAPKGTQAFSIQLNSDDFRSLLAGFYTMKADVNFEGKTAETEGTIKFVEKNLVTTTKKQFGLFVNTNIIEKENKGNTIEHSETVLRKNIISRLFTTFSPEPTLVERDGAMVYYTWAADVRPGETFDVVVKTNWLFPLLIILFLVGVVVAVRQFTDSNISIRKRVYFVKAHGGEFALKVSLFVTAKRYVERVNVVDRLPALVRLYEKFAGDRPSKVDMTNRRLEWNFEKLAPGEKRQMNYIIYSKIGVLGKFALPTALAIFERNGVIHEEESNRAFFVAEQNPKAQDEK